MENGSLLQSVYSLCLSDLSIQQNTVTVNTFTLLLVQRSLKNIQKLKEDGRREETKIWLTSTKTKKKRTQIMNEFEELLKVALRHIVSVAYSHPEYLHVRVLTILLLKKEFVPEPLTMDRFTSTSSHLQVQKWTNSTADWSRTKSKLILLPTRWGEPLSAGSQSDFFCVRQDIFNFLFVETDNGHTCSTQAPWNHRAIEKVGMTLFWNGE